MSFINPLFLLGLIGAVIPIVIHYLNRQQRQQVRIPTFEFLVGAKEESVWWHDLRRWLLLAVRLLLIALLVAIFARPVLTGCSSNAGGESRVPESIAFVVDTSASIHAKGGDERLQAKLLNQIDELNAWDEAAIIAETASRQTLMQNKGQLRNEVESIRPGYGSRSNLKRLVRRAESVLEKGSNPSRRIVVLSDMTERALAGLEQIDVAFPVSFLPVFETGELKNVGIESVEFSREGRQLSVRVTLQRYQAESPVDAELSLIVDGQTAAESTTRIESNTTVETFHHLLERQPKDILTGVVHLSLQDDYKLDNEYYFALRGDRSLNALIINGEPSDVSYSDEVFFLTRALGANREGAVTIDYQVGTPDRLRQGELRPFDLVWLANEDSLDTEAVRTLKAFSKHNGGVIVSLGDQVDRRRFNEVFSDLTQIRVRDRRVWSQSFESRQSIGVRAPDSEEQFFDDLQVAFEDIRVQTHMLYRRKTVPGIETLLRLDNGAPLLRREQTPAPFLVWATSIDDEWSNFPLTRSYVPLVHRMARAAGGRLKQLVYNTTAGASLDNEGLSEAVPNAALLFQAPSPDEPNPEWVDAKEAVTKAPLVFEKPGLFRWDYSADSDTDAGERGAQTVYVNTTRRESDFKQGPVKQLREQFRKRNSRREGNSSNVGSIRYSGNPLWPWLMLGFICLLVGESFLQYSLRD